MGDPFRHVRPGQKIEISTETWNAILDAAKAYQKSQRNRTAGPLLSTRSATIIRVKNESGDDVARGGVLGLGAPIFLPSQSEDAFLREVTFRGVLPDDTHAGKFAVPLEPIRSGGIGRCFVGGVCQVKVDVVDEGHTCAEVDPGSTSSLVSSEDGSAEILWKAADDEDAYSTGEQWAVIRFGTTCGTNHDTATGRCDCPEDTYEVEVDCGNCAAYYGAGTRMPKYWWLDLRLPSDPYGYGPGYGYGYYDDCSVACEQLGGLRAKLTNEEDAYGEPTCTW